MNPSPEGATTQDTLSASSRPAAPPGTAPAFTPVAGRWLVLVIVLCAVFMQLLDTTITMVAIPPIQEDLDASLADIQLVVAFYALAFACMLVTGGRLGDIYGRKKVFLIGMAGFTIASALCGVAPNADFLVYSRVLQGLCSGMMFPQALSIIQVSFAEKEKPKALAIYGATIGLATVLGPVLGGGLIDLDIAGTDWRAIFYVNLPIGILALLAGLVKMTESKAEGSSRLDLSGAGILTTGLFLLILPLVIGREHDWPAWSLGMIAVSPLVLIFFGLVERAKTKSPDGAPLVRTTLFKDRSFTVGLLICLVFFAGIPSFFMTLIMTLQIGFDYDAVSAGAVTLGFAVCIAIASARSAVVVKRLGTWTLLLGTVLLLVGMLGVIATLRWADTDLHGYQLVPALMVGGVGTGLFLAPCTGIIMEGIKGDDAGSASGVLATTQQVGIAIGIAMIGIIFASQIGSNAGHARDSVLPQLRKDLVAAGLPAQDVGKATDGFSRCFHDRTHQKDLTADPTSCRQVRTSVQALPAPAAVKAKVRHAVQVEAAPEARKDDFSRSFQGALVWQLCVFGASALLVLALPKVKPVNIIPGGA